MGGTLRAQCAADATDAPRRPRCLGAALRVVARRGGGAPPPGGAGKKYNKRGPGAPRGGGGGRWGRGG